MTFRALSLIMLRDTPWSSREIIVGLCEPLLERLSLPASFFQSPETVFALIALDVSLEGQSEYSSTSRTEGAFWKGKGFRGARNEEGENNVFPTQVFLLRLLFLFFRVLIIFIVFVILLCRL